MIQNEPRPSFHCLTATALNAIVNTLITKIGETLKRTGDTLMRCALIYLPVLAILKSVEESEAAEKLTGHNTVFLFTRQLAGGE